MKLKYSDFKVGEVLVCVKQTVEGYLDDERLILNESYTITDVDWHFPEKVCVKLKGPYYTHEEFVPIECFSDLAYKRNLKLEEIGI